MRVEPNFSETAANLLGDFVTIAELAIANGGCKRYWRKFLDAQRVPFAKLVGTRRYRRADVEGAIARLVDESAPSREPRTPGRPRKNAA